MAAQEELSPTKVLVKSPFSMFSGYGQDGLGLIRGLAQWGCDVYVQPTWVDCPIPRDLLPLFGKTLRPPFDLTINHWTPAEIEIGEAPRRVTRLAVAWTMWEFQRGPNGGSAFSGFQSGPHPVPPLKEMRERYKWFDLVLGYDPVSIQALVPVCSKHTSRGLLQGGYPAKDWPYQDRDWFSDRFGFIMHGALNGRKQPWLVVEAFRQLQLEHPDDFGQHATLSFHDMAGGLPADLHSINPKMKVWQESWDHDTLLDFYKYNHVLLAPSVGEGKNLPALEMLSTGGTVIATAVGGHTMWLRDDIAYPLEWDPFPMFPKRPNGPQGAQVPLKALKDAMWHAYTHRSECKRKGELAAELIPKQCDWSVVVENFWRRIRDLVPHNGDLIYNMAMDCHRLSAVGAFAGRGDPLRQ